jgi:hypothetical protein
VCLSHSRTQQSITHFLEVLVTPTLAIMQATQVTMVVVGKSTWGTIVNQRLKI